jgi:hypothetical protein
MQTQHFRSTDKYPESRERPSRYAVAYKFYPASPQHTNSLTTKEIPVLTGFKVPGLLRCDAVQDCGKIPAFRRTILPPCSGWSNWVVWNVDILTTTIRGCIQNFPDWVDNEINNNKNKHSLRSNTKSYGGKTHQTDSQNSDTTAPSGRELYDLQFSLQATSPETFGYTFVNTVTIRKTWTWIPRNCAHHCSKPLFTPVPPSDVIVLMRTINTPLHFTFLIISPGKFTLLSWQIFQCVSRRISRYYSKITQERFSTNSSLMTDHLPLSFDAIQIISFVK